MFEESENTGRSVVIRDRDLAFNGELVKSTDAATIEQNLRSYQEDARGAYSTATERALRSDSVVFGAWCSSRGLCALPADPVTVAAFIDHQSEPGADGRPPKKPATIRRYVSSISHMHRAADVPNPCERSKVKLALKRMGKANGSAQRQAEGMTRRLLDRMLHAGGDSLRDLRNRMVLAVAYDTLARRSELVAMLVEDIRGGSHGDGTINIRRSKTDQLGEGSIRYLAPDTMRLVREWIGKAGLESGPLLRGVLKGSRVGGPLHPQEINRIYKELAAAAGLPLEMVEAISAHSTRVGAAQDMAEANLNLPAIMRSGGWKSPEMVSRYTRELEAASSGSAQLAAKQGTAGKR